MIATRTGASEGVGFALPINMAVNVYNQIIKTGKVSRGAIGIQFRRDNNAALLKAYGAKEGGVFVGAVTKGTPAARAGIQEGDIITAFNGKPVKDEDDLVSRVSETPVGTSVPFTVLRDGKPMQMNIEIADRGDIIAGDARGGRPEGGQDRGEGQQSAKFGMSVQNLRPADRESMNLESGGVVVSGVDNDSFAQDIGIQEGDVIVSINRQAVNTAEDLKRIGATLKPGDAVAFKVLREAGAGVPRRQQQGPGDDRGGNWQPLFLAGTLPSAQ